MYNKHKNNSINFYIKINFKNIDFLLAKQSDLMYSIHQG